MAEENNLENELDENLAPDVDAGIPDVIDTGEQPIDGESSNTDSSPQGIVNRLKAIPKTILSSRRNIIIAVVVLLVLFIGSFLLLSSGKKANDPMQPIGLGQEESPTFDSSNIVKKKPEKKKKKKIKYIDLYKQLEGRQMSPILRELSYKNIDYNVIQNGKQFDLQVDEDQVAEAKQVLAIKGMPSDTVKGYEIFDEASNLGVTEFDKRIRLIRALSGEMEKAIMEFDVVDYAYVEIVIPETRLFAVTQPPVTSSILIKRRNGANINYETVYAIMQLVANSVENLSPENISVVDTEGRVLSTGVLDRMTTKIEEIEKSQQAKAVTDIGKGKVIIPVIEDVVDWFQLKFNYESVLEKKALNQLNGVLPTGSFKTAVTIDLNSVTQTGAPDIKQIVSSVVVDDQFEEVELNDETMNQIKQAVAGAIGYVEGRDIIHISKAAFLPKRVFESEQGIQDVPTEIVLPKDTVFDKIKRAARLWPIFGIGVLITSGILIVGVVIKTTVQNLIAGIISLSKLFNRKKEQVDVIEDIDVPEEDVIEEKVLTEQDVVNGIKTKSDFSKVIQLKATSSQELELVVDELKELIKG